MKNKLIAAISLIIFTLAFFTGCKEKTEEKPVSSSSSTSVKKDLANYLEKELPKVSELEATAINSYSSVSGNNYTDDSTMYDTMKKTVIPTYTSFVDKLEKISPKTKQVKEAHQIYVAAAKAQLKGFNQIITALKEQDENMITQANSNLTKAKDGIQDFQDKITELCDEYDVEVPW